MTFVCARITLWSFGVTNLEGDQSIAFPLDLLQKQEEVLKFRFADETYLLKIHWRVCQWWPFTVYDEDQEKKPISRSAIVPSDLGR